MSLGPQRFGDYELLRQIGAGSFGVVFEARHTKSGEQVALKVLKDLAALEEQDFKRFWLEGQLGLRLRAPGLVPVVDAGHFEGRPYLAMEFVPGTTLAARLRAGPPSVAESTRWLIDLAEAVGVIHAEGALHRDLKPANIMLDERSGRPRVTDFGLARDPSLIRSLTQTGELLGTPAYMAPEQVLARKGLDRRLDVYSLGAIYFECLTGRPPHQAQTLIELFDRITTVEPPPPSSLRPGLDPLVDAICRRALAHDPSDRYLDCRALSADLQRVLALETAPESRAEAKGSRLAIGGALIALLSLALLLLLPASVPPAAATAQTPSPPPSAAPTVSEERLDRAGEEVRQLFASRDPRGPQLAKARALAWAPLALRALGNRAFEPEQVRDLAFVLDTAGVEVAQPLTAALDRWLKDHQGQLPGPGEAVLHRLFQDYRVLEARSRLDLWGVETLVERGEFARAEAFALAHSEHVGREGSLRARLLLGFAAYGKRSGWRVGPDRFRALHDLAPTSAVGLTANALLRARESRRLRRDPEAYQKALHEAEVKAREALSLEPTLLPAQLALAQALSLQGSQEAPDAWAKARELGPRSALVPMAKLWIYRRREGPEKRATQDRCLTLTRGTRSYLRASNLRDRGWARVLSGEEGAQADLEEAATLRPFELRVQFGLGVLAARSDRSEEARKLLCLAAALAPEHHRGEWRGVDSLVKLLPARERQQVRAISTLPDFSHFVAEVSPAWRETLTRAYRKSALSCDASELAQDLDASEAPGPLEPDAAFALAFLCIGRDFLVQAKYALRCAPPGRATALLEADLTRRRGFLRRAERKYEALMSGDDAVALAAAGERALLRGDWARAAKAGAALEAMPDPWQAGRALMIQAKALIPKDPSAALILAARARTLQGEVDVRALIIQAHANVALIKTGHRARLPAPLFQALPSLAPAGHAALGGALALLDLARDRPREDLFQITASLLEIAFEGKPGKENPQVHVAQGSLALTHQQDAARTLLDWKRALELDPEVAFPLRDMATFAALSPQGVVELRQARERAKRR
jgi:protein kinase-like protein